MDYYDTLNVIDSFMVNSGIRVFCRSKCRGQCCKPCKFGNSCDLNENKRLMCASFICYKMFSSFPQLYENYVKVKNELKNQAIQFVAGNVYYNPPGKEMFTNFWVDDNLINSFFNKDNAELINFFLDRGEYGKNKVN